MFNLRDENGTLKSKLPNEVAYQAMNQPGHWEQNRFVFDDDLKLTLARNLFSDGGITIFFWKKDFLEPSK